MKYCTACLKTYPTEQNVCPADHTQLQLAHDLQPGMIIRNKYQILERIGVGGMGLVYRGRHLTFNELCAIKIVNDSIAGNANFLKRFQTEAVIMRKLRHPNAVRVEDFDYTEDGRPFIVMELVEGKNIGDVIQSEGALSVPRAIRIARQTAQAIGVAHKLGIVHRDLKPGNIILATDEHGQEAAKVLDFGIAKLMEAAGADRPEMTMTGMVVGTPLYMSPEQFMGKKAGGEIDGRSDIYSLGIVLYQMITAQLPFEADTTYALMLQHLQGTVCPPHQLKPELNIPVALSQLILKAMEKSREHRFQSAEDFVAALDQVTTPLAPDARASYATPASSVPPATATTVIAEPQAPTKPTPATDEAAPASAASIPAVAPPTPAPPVPAPAVAEPLPAPTAVARTEPAATAKVPSNVVPSGPGSDPRVINSAEQHVFLPPRSLNAKLLLRVVGVVLAAVLVGSAGYLKYRSVQRFRIEGAVVAILKAAPSPNLSKADLRVFVSDRREVTLDGKVQGPQDSDLAARLAASVPGVTHVNNRLIVAIVPGESSASLIEKGLEFLDAGDYPSAIACFRKALTDPNNKGAQQLLDRAQRAQQTEEELLKNRQ